MRLSNLTIGIIMAACAAAVRAEPTTIEFRYAPKAGEEMRHRLVMNSVGTLSFAPNVPGTRFTQSTTQETAGKCRQVDPDGSAIFDMKLTRIATRMNTPGMKVDYDSRTFDPEKTDNVAVRMFGRLYSGLVGSELTISFNPQGSPVKVSGMRQAIEKALGPLKKELANEPTGFLVAPFIDNLAAAFDDSMIGDQLKSFYRFVPTGEGPIPIGKTWDADWDMELPFLKTTCQAKGHYELLGVETVRGRECAKIGIKESFAMNTDPGRKAKTDTRPSPGLARLFEKMDMSLSASNGEGVAHWDYRKGVLVQLRQTQRIAITVKFNPKDILAMTAPAADTAPAAEQAPQTFTQNVTSSIQVDLLEGEADEPATRKASGASANP